MKRILVILLVLIVLLAGGAYFLITKALVPDELPANVMNAEEAMATSGTIAIASLDMSFVRRVDKILNASKDPAPLVKPKPAKTLLDKIKKQGVNLYSQTDYALATVNIGPEKPAYSVALFGRFSSTKIKKVIQQSHLLEEGEDGIWLITKLIEEKKNIDPCAAPASLTKKSVPKQQAIHIKNDRVLISSPEMMPVLLKRFAKKSRAEVSLTKWRNFRKNKVLAGTVMSPKQAKKGAVDLSSAILLGSVSEQPITELYGGAEVQLIPAPGFSVLVDAHSNSAEWPLDVKTKYDAWLSETVLDLKEMPTLASLFKTLNVQADGNILRFKTMADQSTLNNIEKIPAEFFKMIFENVSFGDDKGGAEQIVKDEDVKKYASTYDFTSAEPFDVKSSFYNLDYVVGPFGVRLKRIGLLATDHSVIELKVSADGKGFENLAGDSMHMPDDSPAASLIVTSVEDKEGNNLLREEQCGKTRNSVAASLNTSRDKEYIDGKWISKSIKVSGDKSVRLKENVPLSQVVNIKGKIIIRAATRTKVHTVQRPFKNKILKTNKVRMFLKKSNSKTVKYDLSGEMNHILAIRAKNAKGQYLADSGSSSSGDDVKTISKRFKGNIASIEVVVAEEMVDQEYPFEIKQFSLQYGKAGNGNQIGMMTTSKKAILRKYAKAKYKDECKDKPKIELEGFMVCLNKFGDRWGQEVGGEFDVVAPADEALQNDLRAGVLSIDSVQTDTGEKISFNKKERISFDYKFDTIYDKKKKDWNIVNKRLYGSNVSIYSNSEELKNKKIKLVNGTLTIRIPKEPKHFELAANEIGVFKKDNGLIANISAFEDWSTYIDLQGPVDNVMRFMAVAKGGTILKTGNDRINEKEYSTWGKSYEEKEKIKTLAKKWQGMITIYGKPEVIRVYYASNFDVIERKFQFSVNN